MRFYFRASAKYFPRYCVRRFFEPLYEKAQANALVLSGGNSLGESREKDETELAMISYAEQKGYHFSVFVEVCK